MSTLKRLLSVSFLLLLSSTLLIACSAKSEETADPNLKVVKRVLELQFNGPDKELMDLVWNQKYTTIIEGKEVNKKLDTYIEDVYGPYFTDFYLETFMNTSGLNYPSSAYLADYTLQLKDSRVDSDKAVSNRYTFIATVKYQKSDEKEQTADVSGFVLFSTEEPGNIGKFEYTEDDGLLDEMNN